MSWCHACIRLALTERGLEVTRSTLITTYQFSANSSTVLYAVMTYAKWVAAAASCIIMTAARVL